MMDKRVQRTDKIRFEVRSALDVMIRTTEGYWKLITELKHPIIKKYEDEIKETLRNPDEVRVSKKDSTVFLYYKQYRRHRDALYLRVDQTIK